MLSRYLFPTEKPFNRNKQMTQNYRSRTDQAPVELRQEKVKQPQNNANRKIKDYKTQTK